MENLVNGLYATMDWCLMQESRTATGHGLQVRVFLSCIKIESLHCVFLQMSHRLSMQKCSCTNYETFPQHNNSISYKTPWFVLSNLVSLHENWTLFRVNLFSNNVLIFLSFSDKSTCANDGKAPESATFYETYEECCKLSWMDVNICLANKPTTTTQVTIPVQSNYCQELTKRKCNQDAFCAWNDTTSTCRSLN